jgi:hypothetical protein
MRGRAWLGPTSLGTWTLALLLFLILPQFPRVWLSPIWPSTVSALLAADFLAIVAALVAAISVDKRWWWSVAGSVAVFVLIAGSVFG